jgi:hypothetical protein
MLVAREASAEPPSRGSRGVFKSSVCGSDDPRARELSARARGAGGLAAVVAAATVAAVATPQDERHRASFHRGTSMKFHAS